MNQGLPRSIHKRNMFHVNQAGRASLSGAFLLHGIRGFAFDLKPDFDL